MPTLSLIDIARDPDLGERVVVQRTTGAFGAGGWTGTTQNIPAYGPFVVADAEALNQVPEGDRVQGGMQFITEMQVYETSEQRAGISDMIAWRGNNYRIVSVLPWGDFGFWSAVCQRMTGS